MSHISLRPDFEELIELDAPAIQLATDCVFTEGPVWHPVDHFLLFSDMPGDVRRRWDPNGGRRRGQASVEQMQRHDL